MEMCPLKERLFREMTKDLSVFEMVPGTENDAQPQIKHEWAVKKFARPSVDYEELETNPDLVRPPQVLRQTMDYLLDNIVDQEDYAYFEMYNFVRDRTRGIRQDFVFQGIDKNVDAAAIEIYEQIARFHIVSQSKLSGEEGVNFEGFTNVEQLNKCLISLKQFYEDLEKTGHICPNESEFQAYFLLTHVRVEEFEEHFYKLKKNILKSKQVSFAVEVWRAKKESNYIRFFQLVKKADYLQAAIMQIYFTEVRVKALKVMQHAYSNPKSITLSSFVKKLEFESEIEAKNFCSYYGVDVENGEVILDKNRPLLKSEKPFVSLGKTHSIVESKMANQTVKSIVIGKNTPLSSSTSNYQRRVSTDSFRGHNTSFAPGSFLSQTPLSSSGIGLNVQSEEIGNQTPIKRVPSSPLISPPSPRISLAAIEEARKKREAEEAEKKKKEEEIKLLEEKKKQAEEEEKRKQEEIEQKKKKEREEEIKRLKDIADEEERKKKLAEIQKREEEEKKEAERKRLQAIEEEKERKRIEAEKERKRIEEEKRRKLEEEERRRKAKALLKAKVDKFILKRELKLEKRVWDHWKRIADEGKPRRDAEKRRNHINNQLKGKFPKIFNSKREIFGEREDDINQSFNYSTDQFDRITEMVERRSQSLYSPLDLPHILNPILTNLFPQYSQFFTKILVTSSSNLNESERNEEDVIRFDTVENWALSKLSRGPIDYSSHSNSTNLSLYSTRDSTNSISYKVCVKYIRAEEDRHVENKEIYGAQSILFLLDSSNGISDWNSAFSPLRKVLDSLPSHSNISLCILSTSHNDREKNDWKSEIESKWRIELNVRHIISSCKVIVLGPNIKSLNDNVMIKIIQWMATKRPEQPDQCLNRKNLLEYLVDKIGLLFSSNLEGSPNQMNSIFNQILDKAIEEVADPCLQGVMWPIPDFERKKKQQEGLISF